MARKHYEWKVRDKVLQLGPRTLIAGVLNVTPDSFSDGDKYADPDRAFARAIELEEEGADIIDIGAESTRPGSRRISEAEELRRLVPVLKRLRNRLTVPISVDTYKSGVAEKALELGADIINDPSGLTFDAELASKAVQADAGIILNHMRGTPETWAKLPPMSNPVSTIAAELAACVHRAVRAGVGRKHIVIDPGLGFGKRKEQNSEILACLDELARLELPILVGPSRKQFVAKETLLETDFATAAAVTTAILHGAHMVRVHDVKMMKAVVEVADEIAGIRQQIHQARADAEAEAKAAAKAERQEKFRQDRQDGMGQERFGQGRLESGSDPRSLRFPRPAVRPIVTQPVAAIPPMELAPVTPALEMPATEAPRAEDAAVQEIPQGFPPAGGRTFSGKPAGGRPGGSRYDSPRPGGERGGGFRGPRGPRDDRGFGGREGGGRGPSKSGDDRRGPGKGGFRTGPREGGSRNDDRRPGGSRPGGSRPSGSRPGGSRPGGSRPGGSRPSGSRPSGSRPSGSRPSGSRPEGKGFRGKRDGSSPSRPPRRPSGPRPPGRG